MIDLSYNFSLRKQCEALFLNRSSLYYVAKDFLQDTDISNEIHDIWQEQQNYGYRKITAELQRRGYKINHKKVRILMQKMRICALYPKPNLSKKSLENKVFPYLLRGLEITHQNQVWATDITYIKLPSGFAYLIAIIDLFSRYIISWRISNTMETSFCLQVLENALIIAKPEILNTDQGSQFTSNEWIKKLVNSDVKVSMDGVGRWVDNVFIERFWRTVKSEYLRYLQPQNMQELQTNMQQIIELYNKKRLHQSLNYNTPNEVYHGLKIINKINQQKVA
jgi:putative transposase